MPWVQDGLTGFESDAVVSLKKLGLESEQVLFALLDRDMDWFPPHPDNWIHADALEFIASLSARDEEAGLRVVRMPFLETFEVFDSEALKFLNVMARVDTEYLREALSHPVFGTNTNGVGVIVVSLYLRLKDPEAAAAVERMTWFQDEIIKSTEGSEYSSDLPDLRQETALIVLELALSSREVFMALASKPWMNDQFTISQFEALLGLVDIAGRSKQTALRLLDMPFLDMVDRGDDLMLEIMLELMWSDPGRVRDLLDHPELADGITDDDRTFIYMIRLELQAPEAAEAFGNLPWARDGVVGPEKRGAEVLIRSALDSPGIFYVLLDKPWVKDGITLDESNAIAGLSALSSISTARNAEAEALHLLEMPFLESVDGVDAKAIESLRALLWVGDGAYLRQVLSHPALGDGISDEEAMVVAVLSMVVYERPELLDALLDPELTLVEERVIFLPLAGDTRMFVVSVDAARPVNMDSLESVVRMVEEFMAVPFPRSYFGLLVADATSAGGGGGPGGIITVDPGSEHDVRLIAHETAHVYWGFAPRWLQEGPAEFMSVITESELTGEPAGPHDPSCGLAGNLGELDRLEIEYASREEDIDAVTTCPYTLGLGLFWDLYQELDPESFRQGFGNLYLKLETEENGECTGLERAICYVKAAFVDDAPLEAAAIAAEIIDKWYYGSPMDQS